MPLASEQNLSRMNSVQVTAKSGSVKIHVEIAIPKHAIKIEEDINGIDESNFEIWSLEI